MIPAEYLLFISLYRGKTIWMTLTRVFRPEPNSVRSDNFV